MQEMQERHRGGDLLTATQVQERLGVDRSTVYRMALDGRLQALKVGKQWRFPAEAIASLLGGHRSAASPAAAPAEQKRRRLPSLATAAALIEVTASQLGVMMVVTDMAGVPITDVANPCPWFLERGNSVLDACVADWRQLADDLPLNPAFRTGPFSFDCARAYIRDGNELIGMVLAGGVVPVGGPAGMYELDDAGRSRVLEALPRVAAALSRSRKQETN